MYTENGKEPSEVEVDEDGQEIYQVEKIVGKAFKHS